MALGRKRKFRNKYTLARFDKENDAYIKKVCKLGGFTKTDFLNWEMERVRLSLTPKQLSKQLAKKRNTISKACSR